MAGNVEPLDYAGRTPVQAAGNRGEGGENAALAEGCAAILLAAGFIFVGGIVLLALGYQCLLWVEAFRSGRDARGELTKIAFLRASVSPW